MMGSLREAPLPASPWNLRARRHRQWERFRSLDLVSVGVDTAHLAEAQHTHAVLDHGTATDHDPDHGPGLEVAGGLASVSLGERLLIRPAKPSQSVSGRP